MRALLWPLAFSSRVRKTSASPARAVLHDVADDPTRILAGDLGALGRVVVMPALARFSAAVDVQDVACLLCVVVRRSEVNKTGLYMYCLRRSEVNKTGLYCLLAESSSRSERRSFFFRGLTV